MFLYQIYASYKNVWYLCSLYNVCFLYATDNVYAHLLSIMLICMFRKIVNYCHLSCANFNPDVHTDYSRVERYMYRHLNTGQELNVLFSSDILKTTKLRYYFHGDTIFTVAILCFDEPRS